MGTSERET